jgi:hypothetical protein
MFLKSLYKEPKRIRPFVAEDLLTLKKNKVISNFIQHEFNSTEKAKKKNGQLFFERKQTLKKTVSSKTSSSIKIAHSRFDNLKREIINKETKIQSNDTARNLNNQNKPRSAEATRNTSSFFQEKLNIDDTAHSKLLSEIKQDGFKGKFGLLRINLKWHTKDDLDLAVLDPNGRKISYQNKSAISQGSIGKLDVDANSSETNRNPQENIFWENNPPEGYYKIYTTHFSVNEKKNVPFVLSIISKKGKSDILDGNIYHGKMNTKLVAIIHYNRLNGVTSITKKNILIDAS